MVKHTMTDPLETIVSPPDPVQVVAMPPDPVEELDVVDCERLPEELLVCDDCGGLWLKSADEDISVWEDCDRL